ncbi:MAG: hypothetical protein KBG15_13285 [Kofleriaceae bacterium]|nr:hypothetical protein [Kofleriaceae bacterium]
MNNPPGLVISPRDAREALHAIAERHGWWAAGFALVAIAGFLVAAISMLMPSDDAMLYIRSFFLIGAGTAYASWRRNRHAKEVNLCIGAVARGAVARLVNGGIEVTVDGSLQRIELSSAAAAKLTAQLVPPARARLT